MAKRYEYSDEVWGVVSELFIKPSSYRLRVGGACSIHEPGQSPSLEAIDA